MFVNQHVYGLPAAHAPVIHLRQLEAGDLFTTYAEAFERIWSTAEPAWPTRRSPDHSQADRPPGRPRRAGRNSVVPAVNVIVDQR